MAALSLLGLTVVTFVIGRFIPVDPVLAIVGDRASRSTDPGDQQAHGAAVEERDATKREGMYKDLQQTLLDDSPFIIMFQEVKQTAERSNLQGLVVGPTQDVVLYGYARK